jgi:hypothetical protein
MQKDDAGKKPTKSKSTLDGGLTFFAIVAVIVHSTIGFFVEKGWNYVWKTCSKTRKKLHF